MSSPSRRARPCPRRADGRRAPTCPSRDAPVTMPSKLLADARLEQQRRGGLAHLALDLVRGVLLLACSGAASAPSSSRRSTAACAGERRLEQALRDEVGVAAVRRGRVRVVLHRQAEVPDRLLARASRPRTRRRPSLDDRQREIGEAQRVGFRCAQQELLERARVGIGRQRVAELGGDRLRCGPSAPASARRGGGSASRASSRKRAVDAVRGDHEVLDQLLGALLRRSRRADRRRVRRRTPAAPRSSRGRARRARAAARASGLRDAVLQPQVVRRARSPRATCGGSGPLPSSHAPTRVVGELGLVVHERAVDVAAAPPRRRRRPSSRRPRARRSSPSLSEVRSVDSFSGSIGKMRAAV